MNCCKHCNWFNTDKCDIEILNRQLEEEEISQDDYYSMCYDAMMRCDDSYHDHQLDEYDARNDR